jgi:hypothetical protein
VPSHVQFESSQMSNTICVGLSRERDADSAKPSRTKPELVALAPSDPYGETAIPEVFAHGAEFVAVPGQSERLQREIPLVMRAASKESGGFCGCVVLFSEQEARLVTVITLWTTRDQAKHCNEKRLKRLLEPYVDRWLRVRSFVGFFPCPSDS